MTASPEPQPLRLPGELPPPGSGRGDTWQRALATVMLAGLVLGFVVLAIRLARTDDPLPMTARELGPPPTAPSIPEDTVPFEALAPLAATGAGGEPGLAGPEQTVAPAPAATLAAPAATAPPGVGSSDPASLMRFSYSGARCEAGGILTVLGEVTNGAMVSYSLELAISVLGADGTQVGAARAVVSAVWPGQQQSFSAQGSCTEGFAPGIRPETQIVSITPA